MQLGSKCTGKISITGKCSRFANYFPVLAYSQVQQLETYRQMFLTLRNEAAWRQTQDVNVCLWWPLICIEHKRRTVDTLSTRLCYSLCSCEIKVTAYVIGNFEYLTRDKRNTNSVNIPALPVAAQFYHKTRVHRMKGQRNVTPKMP